MTRRHPVRESDHLNLPGQLIERLHPGIQGLVNMEVDRQSRVRGRSQRDRDIAGGIRVEGGCSANDIDSQVDRGAQGGPVGGTLGAGQRKHRQRADLHVNPSGGCFFHAADGRNAPHTDLGAHVDVGANGGHAIGQVQLEGLAGSPGDVVDRHRGQCASPGVDRAEQVPRRVRDQAAG